MFQTCPTSHNFFYKLLLINHWITQSIATLLLRLICGLKRAAAVQKQTCVLKNTYRIVYFIYSLLTERADTIFALSFCTFCGVKEGLAPRKTPVATLDIAFNMVTYRVKGRVTWSHIPLAQRDQLRDTARARVREYSEVSNNFHATFSGNKPHTHE